MKAIHHLFHTMLHSLSPNNDVNLSEEQRSYHSSSTPLVDALNMQEAIMKHMKRRATIQSDDDDPIDNDPDVHSAVFNNLQRQEPACEWVDLADALLGPAHVTRKLIQSCQLHRSTPERQYKFNEEQLQCVALFVQRLDVGFKNREDASQPWIDPGQVLMTLIMDGGGGCGKTTLSTDILLPLLESCFAPAASFGEPPLISLLDSLAVAHCIQARD